MAQAQALQAKALGGGNATAAATIAPASSLSTAPSARAWPHADTNLLASRSFYTGSGSCMALTSLPNVLRRARCTYQP